MKAVMIFKLPEEAEEFRTYQNANKYHCAIHEYLMFLRQKYKYEDAKVVDVEEARDKFWEILNDLEIAGEF